MREEAGGLVIGGYEPNPLARWIDGAPWEHGGTTLPADYDRFEQLLEGAIRRIPFLDKAGIITLVCHPGAYTPDCQPLLGPMAGARGMWIAAGMSLNGYGGAGGIGKLMAEWIVEGEPRWTCMPFAPLVLAIIIQARIMQPSELARASNITIACASRTMRMNGRDRIASARSIPGCRRWARSLERSLAGRRVNFFQPGEPWRRAGADQREWGWNRPPYFERVGQEHQATRERVTLFDLTSFGKIEVSGPGALPLLQRVADGDMDKPVGSATYTQFLNTHGGVEADLTVTRLGKDLFRVVTGSAFIGNDLAWLRMFRKPEDGQVTIRDITMDWACLALWGPKARSVLQKITQDDVSNEAFPYLHAGTININGAEVWAQRVSYVGELGWELYVPTNSAELVWDALLKAGAEFGIEVGGYKVLDSLRLEKGYRYYTADVTPLETPYEGGLGFCVNLDKQDKSCLSRLTQKPNPPSYKVSSSMHHVSPCSSDIVFPGGGNRVPCIRLLPRSGFQQTSHTSSAKFIGTYNSDPVGVVLN